jgi:type I restriction enzyme S subunit
MSDAFENKLTIGDVVNFKRGYDLPHRDREHGEIPIISSSGFTGWHKDSMVKGPGVVTGRYGTLGEVFYVEKHYWPLNTSLYVQDFKENNPKFIYYWLQTVLSANFNSAGAVPGVNRNYLHKIKVPDLPISQDEIAAVLSSYDDLIENNNRRIMLLENMAREVYCEWFVRFRFSGYQKAEFEKGYPKGWENDFAYNIFEHVKGKSYKSDEIADLDEESMPFVTLKSFNRGGGYRADGLKAYSGKYRDEQVVHEGDVVMAVTDMTQNREVVGRVARIPDLGPKGAVISLDVIKLVPKTISTTFLYSYMKYSGFGHFIKSFANGANVLHLKPDLVTNQKIVIPPEELRNKFEGIVNPIHEQIGYLTKEIDNLAITKKNLLPRLISGKLLVDDLVIQFPPSMLER